MAAHQRPVMDPHAMTAGGLGADGHPGRHVGN